MATSATTRLRFRLLGPLEVLRDGGPLPLGGERQRGLLALLLLHANELVTTEQLAEQLFGAESSDASIRAVRVAISRLRRLLDDETLETGPGGYLARTDPTQLDVAEFEALVADGRAALDGGDSAAAAASFRSALTLFRGPPLADLVPVDFVQAEIRRLEELRLSAVMDRIDADLALGSAGDLVPELETLVQTNPFQERLRGQLMLALYRAGRQTDALETYRRTRELLAEELGLEPSRALQQLERAILQHDPQLDVGLGSPPAEAATCPFKGLAAFEATDAFYFCGRERLLDEIVTRLASRTFLGIVGPSGVGKSSLLRAGFIPALAAGALPGSAQWRVVLVRGGDGATAIVRDAVGECRVGDRVVIVIDQLEEIFADDVPPDDRLAFFEVLESAATDPASRALVLVAVRADFYGRFADYPSIADRLSQSHIFARSLDREELARAIEIPASRAGLEVERPLVDALVGETAGVAGALPLLQTTLLQLWGARDGRTLRYQSYRDIGGLRGAVGRLAEETFARLSPENQALTRRIMLRLAGGEDGALVRRRVPLADLQRLEGAARVVDALVAARLLTVDDDFLELSHEALLHEWPRYAQWLEDDRVGRHLRAHLAASAAEWDSRGRDRADLYRGARLTAALELPAVELTDREMDFLEASRRHGEVEAERQDRQNRRLRLALAGAAVLLAAAVIAGALALVQRGQARRAATAAVAESVGAQGVSESRIDLAMLLARASVALDPTIRTRSDLLTTLLRVPTAFRVYHWNANRNLAVAVSPDGRTLAIDDNEGFTVVEQAATGRRIGTVHADVLGFGPDNSLLTAPGGAGEGRAGVIEVRDARSPSLTVARTMAFPRSFRKEGVAAGSLSAAGGRVAVLVTHSHDSPQGPAPDRVGVAQYDYASGRVAVPAIRLPDSVSGVSYVDGNRRLIYAAGNRTTVIDARTGSLIRRYPIGGDGFAVSPDGQTAALASGDAIRFLDLHSGKVALGIGAEPGGAVGIGFTPDGKTLITSGEDGKTLLWDVTSHSVRGSLAGHAGPIHAQAIGSDGSTLYTGSFDSNVLGWDLTGLRSFPASFQAIRTEPIGYWNLAVSPDGRTLAVGSTTGRVALWDRATLRRIRTFRAVPGAIGAVAFGDAGRELLVSGPTPTRSLLRIWRLGTNPGVVRTTKVHGFVYWAAWSPDGRTIAAATRLVGQDEHRSGTVLEWNAATGRRIGASVVKGGAPTDVTFAPHGTVVAIGAINAGAEVLDPAHGTVEHKLPSGGLYTLGVTFSPDGKELATTDWRGTLDIWDVATGTRIGARIPDPDHAVTASVAWSPDGKTIALTDGSNTLRLFDVSTRREIGPPFQLGPVGQNNDPYGVFTPDGKEVVVSDDTGRTWVVPVTLRAWEAAACRIADRNFTHSEWKNFFPGRPYRRVCA